MNPPIEPPASLRPFYSAPQGAVLMVLAGVMFATIASQLSLRGPTWFGDRRPMPLGTGSSVGRAQVVIVTNQTPGQAVAGEIRAAGLKLASLGQVTNWLADARYRTRQIIFVDARNEEEYLKGHLPGAWLFNPYEPEKYFPVVLPACQAAEQIIVYCHGGDCDDSVTAANLFKDAGISAGKLWVYAAGMAEWETNRQPLETGPQDSGQFKKVAGAGGSAGRDKQGYK